MFSDTPTLARRWRGRKFCYERPWDNGRDWLVWLTSNRRLLRRSPRISNRSDAGFGKYTQNVIHYLLWPKISNLLHWRIPLLHRTFLSYAIPNFSSPLGFLFYGGTFFSYSAHFSLTLAKFLFQFLKSASIGLSLSATVQYCPSVLYKLWSFDAHGRFVFVAASGAREPVLFDLERPSPECSSAPNRPDWRSNFPRNLPGQFYTVNNENSTYCYVLYSSSLVSSLSS